MKVTKAEKEGGEEQFMRFLDKGDFFGERALQEWEKLSSF